MVFVVVFVVVVTKVIVGSDWFSDGCCFVGVASWLLDIVVIVVIIMIVYDFCRD